MHSLRILLVQTSFLGDTVLSTPVIAALRERYPAHELWVLTTPGGREILKRDPLIHSIISYDKHGHDRGLKGFFSLADRVRSLNFERAFALQRSTRTSLLLFAASIRERIGFSSAGLSLLYHQRKVRPSQWHDVKRQLSLVLPPELLVSDPLTDPLTFDPRYPLRLFAPELSELEAESGLKLNGPYVALCPSSVWPTKRWYWEHFRSLALNLGQLGIRVLVLGSSAEQSICAKVSNGTGARDLSGKTSLPNLMSIIKHAKVVVCNDSLALHMASAFERPTVALFCATSPAFGFGPWNKNAIVLERSGLACKPCRRHGSKVCPTGTEACMKELNPELVEHWVRKFYQL